MSRLLMPDIGLSGIDGNELARRLRTQPENGNATLIALSGYGQEEVRQNAFAAGFDYYLVKPLDTRKLVPILAELHQQTSSVQRSSRNRRVEKGAARPFTMSRR